MGVLQAPLIMVGSGALDGVIKFLVELLAWQWRKYLSTYLHRSYFQGIVYYKIQSMVDNP